MRYASPPLSVDAALSAHWRDALFATLSQGAGSVAHYFKLPDNAVVELGTRVQI